MKWMGTGAATLLAALIAGCGGGGGGGGNGTVALRVTGSVTALGSGTPVENAEVGVPGAPTKAATAADGTFALDVTAPGGAASVTLAVGREGYYNARVEAPADGTPVAVALEPIPAADAADYRFLAPSPLSPGHPNPGMACGYCHTETFAEWFASPHATAATNPRVLDAYSNDFKRGFFEFGIDTCSGCHAPGLATASVLPDHTDAPITAANGESLDGVHCDVCHKVDATIPEATFPGGVYGGATFKRPEGPFDRSRQDLGLMFGPLADSTYPFMRASAHSLFERSEHCAGCHESKNAFGIPAEETYSQWLASPAASAGRTCQDCHMRADTGRTSLLTDSVRHLGPERDTSLVHDHEIQGPSLELLREAAAVTLAAATGDGFVDVSVDVRNAFAGHSLPSGYPSRQILLVVRADDTAGTPLALLGGEAHGPDSGVGEPGDDDDALFAAGNYAGFAGRVFQRDARGLSADGSTFENLVPHWRAAQIVSDTRIAAGAADFSAYRFAAPAAGRAARFTVRLVHRRAPKSRVDWESFEDRPFDVVFFERTIDGSGREIDTTPPSSAATPPGGLFTSAVSVTLSASEPATIYYTTDGSEPTEESAIFSSPIAATDFLRLRFFAVDVAGNAEEGFGEEVYVVRPGGPVLFSEDIQPILTRSCALSIGCHTGTTPAAGMNLAPGEAHRETVGVPSEEVPTLLRVKPFESQNSYLYHKIVGTAGDVGGVPSRMPLGQTPLRPEEIATIREWIDQGAQDN